MPTQTKKERNIQPTSIEPPAKLYPRKKKKEKLSDLKGADIGSNTQAMNYRGVIRFVFLLMPVNVHPRDWASWQSAP
ncbi:hypothetical protein GF1_05610 [Desulfolithobacter dissulfuricans]|uniref:Uncharacterized protein n=1 Tax=Desulfolithobacter dissulfuricans TaxID=2795293 RepID=A0A915XHL5_9BACT|nr:hypothetical protein GF1_05610 [Desulfolithobacter dissulfuricans]